MQVTRRYHGGWTPWWWQDQLYYTHTVGLYIIISVPSAGITLIWDKHTRLTIELDPFWRVCDEDFDQSFVTLFVTSFVSFALFRLLNHLKTGLVAF